MRSIHFNGKFYAGRLNGVHRVADRLIRECDARLAEMPASARPKAFVHVPVKRQWQPELSTIRLREHAGADGQRWEQMVLPRLAADGVLVNLANLAPIAHANKVLLIHDAQFLFPDSSYPWRQRTGYRLLLPIMARTSAVVLTVSDYSRQMLDVLGVAPRARTTRLYNGADHILDAAAHPAALAEFGLEPHGYVLMFGSPKAYKNVGVVLAAFAAAALAPTRLVIVGPSREVLAAAGLVAPADAVFVGSCNDGVLKALYEGALALAFPSRTEGFGLPPVEAMLCDCPVVVSPGGAIPEICRDAALYADIDDPRSWRDAFIALRDPGLRAAKVATGRARARGFTWSAAGAQLLAILLERARQPS